MADVLNYTPFAVSNFGVLDAYARQFDVLALSATFVVPSGDNPRLADQQVPVCEQDKYHGEPGLSSLRYEGESAKDKQFVDVILNGQCYAPNGKPSKQVEVSLRVADIDKKLLVVGDRFHLKGTFGILISSPKPFTVMPILYEHSFGGTTANESFPWNPIGIGYKGARTQLPQIETELPNILPIVGKTKSQAPGGFGVVSRNWKPRISFAGTYDELWQKEQCPLLPLDFDSRFYQAAPVDQQSRVIRGGEIVEVRNLTQEGLWQFKLPRLDVPVRLRYLGCGRMVELRLDTVVIEPDEHRIIMIARAQIPVVRQLGPLKEIIIGHVSNAWWRARWKGKRYLDSSGANGRLVDSQPFVI
jgi:hypothetical protein